MASRPPRTNHQGTTRPLDVMTWPLSQQRPQSLAMRSAGGEAGAVLHGHDVFAVEVRLERSDPVHVHDYRTVDADECGGVEPSLQRLHGFAHQVGLPPGMEPGV